jgi:hypothetical protein
MTRKRKHRSTLEQRVGAILEPAGFDYEAYNLPYQIEHKYTPDFSVGDLMVEVKGWLRPGDRQKYKAIRDSLTDMNLQFVFVLQSPHKKVQKGAKSSISQWCEKEGIPWFAEDDLESLINFALEVEKC